MSKLLSNRKQNKGSFYEGKRDNIPGVPYCQKKLVLLTTKVLPS